MGHLAVVDTADVFVRSKTSGKVFLTAEAQLTSISQTLGINESIFGGIGSRKLFTLKGQKEVTTTIRNALYNKDFLAMTQGVEVTEDSVRVHKREDNLAVTEEGTATIVGTPVDDTVYVRNINGEIAESTHENGVVEVPQSIAKAGDMVSVTYHIETTGNVITIDADKFGESFEVEYRTIGYNTNTNEITHDIYIQLDNVVPNGEFELALENGTPLAPEFTFDALASGGSEIGRIIEIPRNSTP